METVKMAEEACHESTKLACSFLTKNKRLKTATETEKWPLASENGEQYGELRQVILKFIITKRNVVNQLYIVIV